MRTTRLAPSPTGALHLGNAMSFLLCWGLARHEGWRIVLRIEDLDTPRIKPAALQAVIDDLRWLGIDWDDGPFRQADQTERYQAALDRLRAQGAIYPSRATRSDARAAQSAPHRDDHEVAFPAVLRPSEDDPIWRHPDLLQDDGVAWRLRVEPGPVATEDQRHGRLSFNVADEVGDFVVASKAGAAAYQLAVVVDDAAQGVTDIVRGDDLLGSTARQRLLADHLGLATFTPCYWHHPLVSGEDGRRLAKRHGDTRLSAYREAGTHPARVLGLAGWWLGLLPTPRPLTAPEFIDLCHPTRYTLEPVCFTPADDAWLLGGPPPC
ncbi:MAG: tRNA glutamyl-Q(34) synthetase GluQRS [Planctomycetota bacterium]